MCCLDHRRVTRALIDIDSSWHENYKTSKKKNKPIEHEQRNFNYPFSPTPDDCFSKINQINTVKLLNAYINSTPYLHCTQGIQI